MTKKDHPQKHGSPKTRHSHDRIFDYFREIIQQTFVSGSFQGALPAPREIKIKASYEKGLFSICFCGEGREIGEYSPLIDVIGTIMLQQPDCAYFKISERDRYALCGTWASPSMPSQDIKPFLKKILTPGHKVFSFSDRMKEHLVSFLSRNSRLVPKEKAIFRVKR